jgi:hypothetical protein
MQRLDAWLRQPAPTALCVSVLLAAVCIVFGRCRRPSAVERLRALHRRLSVRVSTQEMGAADDAPHVDAPPHARATMLPSLLDAAAVGLLFVTLGAVALPMLFPSRSRADEAAPAWPNDVSVVMLVDSTLPELWGGAAAADDSAPAPSPPPLVERNNIILILADDQDQVLGGGFVPNELSVPTPMPRTRELLARPGLVAQHFFARGCAGFDTACAGAHVCSHALTSVLMRARGRLAHLLPVARSAAHWALFAQPCRGPILASSRCCRGVHACRRHARQQQVVCCGAPGEWLCDGALRRTRAVARTREWRSWY